MQQPAPKPDHSPIHIVDEMEDNTSTTAGTLGWHISEMRRRLIRIVIAVLLIFCLSMIFYQNIWEWALYPREVTAKMLGASSENLIPLQFLTPWDGISSVAGLCIKLSILLALPLILAEAWLYTTPALKRNERKALFFILFTGSILCTGGALIAFFFAVPEGLKFLAGFNNSLSGTVTTFTAESYFSFISMACMGFGICFETPLVMMALTRAHLITPAGIKRYWRHSVLIIAILGAAFTPPDPATMLMLGGCLLLLYLFGYVLSCITYRKQLEFDEEADEISEGE